MSLTIGHRSSRYERRGSGGFWRYWWPAFALLSALTCCWMLATPIGGAPDEPAQILRTVSVVRGQWLGPAPHVRHPGPYTTVRVPATYTQSDPCFAFRADTTAGCQQPPPPASGRVVTAQTYVGRYPPLYYLLVGWPSLLTTQRVGFYLIRLLSGLLNAALLATAFATARRWSSSPILVAGIGVAITPLALFLSAVVNPSGMEIASAITAWVAAAVWSRDHPSSPPRALVSILAIAVMVLVSMRGMSLIWPLFILAAFLPMLWGRLQPLRLLRSRRDVPLWTAGVLVVGVVNFIWVLAAGSLTFLPNAPKPKNTAFGSLLRSAIGQMPGWFKQSIAVVGWLDTQPLWLTVMIWYAAGAGLLVIGLLVLNKRQWLSLGLLLVFSLAFPVVLATAYAPKMGFPEQGRYFLPLTVSLPIAAAAFFPKARPNRDLTARLRVGLAFLIALGNALAFYWALHRYVVGASGPLFGTSGVAHPWHPPLPWQALDAIFAVLAIAYGIFLARRVEPSAVAPPPQLASNVAGERTASL